MDFEKIQLAVQEKILTLGELLDTADQIAKGDLRPKYREQVGALKIAIDARLRLIALWKPQQMDITSKGEKITGFNYIIPNGSDNKTNPEAAPGVGEVA